MEELMAVHCSHIKSLRKLPNGGEVIPVFDASRPDNPVRLALCKRCCDRLLSSRDALVKGEITLVFVTDREVTVRRREEIKRQFTISLKQMMLDD